MVRRGWACFAAGMIALGCGQGQAAKPHDAAPAGSPGDWITPDDYPSEALWASQAGVSGFRLEVAPSGNVARCTITSSSGAASLDEATCRLLNLRARFVPATDRKGRAVAGSFSSAVRWSIPRDDDGAADTAPWAAPCSISRDDEIKVSGLPACERRAPASPPADVDRVVTVAPGKNGPVCTVDVDGVPHELRDDACAAIQKPLREAHKELPATTLVRWQGAFPFKPSN